jgi:hypothetical protein
MLLRLISFGNSIMNNRTSHALRLLFQSLLIMAVSADVRHAQSVEKSVVLKRCRALFGPALDPMQSLFEIDSLHVLEVKFDSQGSLIQLAFSPKHFLQERYPEWKRPERSVYLSKWEYKNLLNRLDGIWSKGRLIKSVAAVSTHNFAARFLDQYENAFLYRVENLDEKEDVRYFSLYFSHSIEGKVKKKQRYSYSFWKKDYYQVSVGKLNYFVNKDDYLKLRIGQVATFLAVGPISNICDGRNCNP